MWLSAFHIGAFIYKHFRARLPLSAVPHVRGDVWLSDRHRSLGKEQSLASSSFYLYLLLTLLHWPVKWEGKAGLYPFPVPSALTLQPVAY